MNHQNAFEFQRREDPFEKAASRPAPKRYPKPPKRKGYLIYAHWVFKRLCLYPPPRKKPPTVYPPRDCPSLAWQFSDEGDLKRWFNLHACHTIWRTFLCVECRCWHAECYPAEVSGQSSGKKLRLDEWLVKNKRYTYDERGELQKPIQVPERRPTQADRAGEGVHGKCA